MSGKQATSMDALDIASFLEDHGTGVLALASDGDAYAIPVSYTFDEDEEAIYFRMGFAPGSQKRRYLEDTDHLSFVVYADTDDGWKSVVVEGSAETLGSDSLDAAMVEAMEGLDIPYYQVHERPATDVEFRIVRVEPTRMSGIVEGASDRNAQTAGGAVDEGSR
ncbi:pyridoxamine 5'-phosphate oxidase family protein [Halorubellus sp. PRR65]|uniref:pyridoxamine 5'-phosphate oxidase family protein n=1 Tax=Halorubellus sp. PRR65 TaxID=3098148 RepID=UPI002B258F0A|nr:pyridoxamine 5'-phosphate oxidase family protein [Halorubellus sp. PRR65]